MLYQLYKSGVLPNTGDYDAAIKKQITDLQKYGYTAEQAEAQVFELTNALKTMSSVDSTYEERIAAERKWQTEMAKTKNTVSEAKLEWQAYNQLQSNKQHNKKDVYDQLDKRTQAYQEILTINEKISRLNPETDSAQIKDLERQRNEWSKINQEAAEAMTYYAQQVLSEEELVQLAKDRANALKQVQNNVATSFAASDEKQSNKESNSTTKRLQTLQNKLDTEQPKYTTKYIDEQVASLQKYGIAADEAERQVKELRQALADMSDTNLSADERLAAEKKYQTELNRTSNVVKEARLEWQGLATEQQRLSLANRIEAFMQKNTKITKSAKEELQRYVTSLRNLDQEMSKVETSNINIFFQETQNRMRALGKLGYALSDQLKQAANSFTQWISVSSLIMTGIYKTRQVVTELKEIDTYLTEISKANDKLSKSDLVEIGNNSFDIASKYGKTATDFLSGVQEASRAGYVNAEGIAELSTAAQGAGDMTADVANQMIIATDKAYKMAGAVDTLRNVLDGVNYITNHNAVNMTELSEGMTIVASTAASFGVDVNELTAALGTMSATTQQSGSEVARAFRAILLNIRQVSDEEEGIDAEGLTKYEAACNALGVSLKETKDGVLSLRDPMEVLKELSVEYNKLEENDIKRTNLLNSVGGKLRATQLDALLRQWSMYEKMLDEYATGTGSMAVEAEKTAQSWEGSLNRLSNTFADTVGNIVQSDTMIMAINTLNEFLGLINSTTDALGSFGTLGMIGAGIASAKGYGLTS